MSVFTWALAIISLSNGNLDSKVEFQIREPSLKSEIGLALKSGNAKKIEAAKARYDAFVGATLATLPQPFRTPFSQSANSGLDRTDAKLWDIKMKGLPYDEIQWDDWQKAVKFRKTMKSGRPNLNWDKVNPENLEPGDYPDGNWTFIGPRDVDNDSGASGMGSLEVTGRIGAIGVSFQNPDTHWYVGGANGGLFKTTNGGATWTEVSQGWDAIAVGSIAVDPNNHDIVYVGTGDPDDQNKLSMGVMKTQNGGATWTQMGEAEFGTEIISDLIVDPDETNTVYVAISSFDTAKRGIWKSTSGGTFWTREYGDAGVEQLEVSMPYLNGRYIWAVPSGSGLLRRFSLPTYTWTNITYPATLKRVACSKTQVLTMYVADETNRQIAKTTNNGFNWNDINTDMPVGTADFWDQAYYDFTFECGLSPNSGDMLSLGLVEHWISRNNGVNWAKISGYGTGDTHVDYHRTVMHPSNTGRIFIGSDGGFYRMDYVPNFLAWNATGFNGAINTSGSAAFTMFYSLATHPTAPSELMGGTQDNGMIHARGNTNDWKMLHGGDGTGTAISQTSPNYQYSTTQRAGWSYNAQNQEIYKIRRSTNGMVTHSVFEFPADDGPPFVPVFHVSNEALPRLYFGSNRLHRLDELSNGLAWANTTVGGWQYGTPITAITTAPSDPSIVYLGTQFGTVFRITNYGAGTPPKQIWDAPIGAPITCISVDPNNANNILFTLQGAESTAVDRLYQCSNTTATTPSVVSRGAGLPDIWTYWVERDPWRPTTVWYLANELGVFYTENAGTTWYDMTEEFGLPRVSVRQLSAEPATNRLYAATYGRGIFRMFIADTRPSLTSATYLASNVAGGDTAQLRVQFDQVVPPQGLTLTLSHSPSNAVQSPTSYTVPGGVTSVDVPVRMAVTNSNVTVTTTVTSSFGGADSDTIFVNNIRLSTFTVSQSTVTASYTSIGTLTLNLPALSGGSTVNLQSTLSALVSVPATVTIPSGATSNTFVIRTYPIYTIQSSADILASLGNSIWRTITVNPISLVSVSASPNPIAGGNAFTGTVQASGVVGPQGMTLALSSNNSAVSVPITVTIPNGSSSATFVGQTAGVAGPGNTVATITATQGLLFTKTTNLTVTPVTVTGLAIKPEIPQGSAFYVTGAISALAPAGGVVINLASSNPRAVWFVPATLSIPAGQFEATARIGRAGNAGQRATITATLNGSSRQTNVQVVRAR